MFVYLDLENTIIVDWYNPATMNHTFFHRFFDNLKVNYKTNKVGIFSFAIDNELDRNKFNNTMKENIEKTFDIEIVEVPTCQEIYQASKQRNSFHMDLFEYKSLWGKVRAFEDWCVTKESEKVLMLVDDVVPRTRSIKFDHDENIIVVIETLRPYVGLNPNIGTHDHPKARK